MQIVAVGAVAVKRVLIKQALDAATQADLVGIAFHPDGPAHLSVPAPAQHHHRRSRDAGGHQAHGPEPARHGFTGLLFLIFTLFGHGYFGLVQQLSPYHLSLGFHPTQIGYSPALSRAGNRLRHGPPGAAFGRLRQVVVPWWDDGLVRSKAGSHRLAHMSLAPAGGALLAFHDLLFRH